MSDEKRAPQYHFVFFRDMVTDSGDRFRCRVDAVPVLHARSPDRALATALKVFERRHRLSNWRDLAHGYEIHQGSAADPPI